MKKLVAIGVILAGIFMAASLEATSIHSTTPGPNSITADMLAPSVIDTIGGVSARATIADSLKADGLDLEAIPNGLLTGAKLNASILKDSLSWGNTPMRIGTKILAGAQVYKWEIFPDSAHAGISLHGGFSAAANAYAGAMFRVNHSAGLFAATPADQGKAAISGISDHVSNGRGVYGYLGNHRTDALGAAIYGDCAAGDSVGVALYGAASGTDYGLYVSGGLVWLPTGSLDTYGVLGAALLDSLKTRVHADSVLKAAKADSAGKVATTFKPTTSVLADTSITVRIGAITYAKLAAATLDSLAKNVKAATSTLADTAITVRSTFKPTTAGTADDVIAGAIESPALATELVSRLPVAYRLASKDTVMNIADPDGSPHTYRPIRIVGEGYTLREMFRIPEAGLDSTFVVMRVDGATACSLTLRDFAGIPQSIPYNSDGQPLTQNGAVEHDLARLTVIDYPSYMTNHIIPFEDSLKVFLQMNDLAEVGGTTIAMVSIDYRLADVTSWGRWKNWRGVVVDTTLADSLEYVLLDTGAGKAGVYIGSAFYAKVDTAMTIWTDRALYFKYDAEANYAAGWSSTDQFIGTGWSMTNGDYSVTRFNGDRYSGVYLYNLDVSGDQNAYYGGYRWFTKYPVAFEDRFRIYSDNDAHYAIASIPRMHWVSFYYIED